VGWSASLWNTPTRALLQADLPLAEQVITDHDRLTAMRARAEENAEAAARLT